MRLIASALVVMVLAGCLMGCNATGDQIKAYAEITQITVDAAARSNVAVTARVSLRPVGGRMIQGFELYGLEIDGNIQANPSSPTTVTVLPATVTP